MTDYGWVIAVAAVIVAVVLWFVLRSRPGAGAPPVERREADREAPADPAAIPPAPVVMGSAGSPLDIAPPPLPVADDARVAAAPSPAEAPAGPADDLTVLKGVGPKLAALLGDLGVTRYDQIAGWTDADLARVDARLGSFRGRPTRDRWVEQAGLLASGDRAGFEAKFGRIDG